MIHTLIVDPDTAASLLELKDEILDTSTSLVAIGELEEDFQRELEEHIQAIAYANELAHAAEYCAPDSLLLHCATQLMLWHLRALDCMMAIND